MSYKPPIEIILDDIEWHIERASVKAVQRYFPFVHEEELAKALKYDRDQYNKGFIDGRAARDAEIVRCKDCIHHEDEEPGMVYCPNQVGGWVSDDFFCADGERKQEEDNQITVCPMCPDCPGNSHLEADIRKEKE